MNVRHALAGLAAILWVASFFLPTVDVGGHWQLGWQIGVSGWAGPLNAQFGWYANVIIIPALGALALGEAPEDFRQMSTLGLLLFLFWVNSLFWKDVPMESGGRQVITAYGPGFYAWMAAVLIGWLGLFLLTRPLILRRREADQQ